MKSYLRFDRTTFVIRTLLSDTLSSVLTVATVVFLFFPLSKTVSPLKRPKDSILSFFKVIIEWSSVIESSTNNVFGVAFLVKMAVASSAFDFCIRFEDKGKRVRNRNRIQFLHIL